MLQQAKAAIPADGPCEQPQADVTRPSGREILTTALARLFANWERWSKRGSQAQPLFLLLVCATLAVRAMLQHASDPLGPYDEGLLFTDAFLMDQGREIYRDFYINYPPGILQITRALGLLSWSPIWSARLFALSVRVASAVLAGWLAGKARREKINLTAVTAVLILQSGLGPTPFAYSVAVFMMLASITLWSKASASVWHAAGGGMLLGLLSYVRHDLFLYTIAVFAPLEAVWYWTRRRSFLAGSVQHLAVLASAALVTTIALWAPHIVASGLSRIVHDIALDQARLTMPGRLLPLPSFSGDAYSALLHMPVPNWIASHLTVSLLIAAAATLVSTSLLPLRLLAEPPGNRGLRIATLLCGFALASLPQALQRTDYSHVAFGAPFTVAALFAMLGRRISTPILVCVLTAWLVAPPAFISIEAAESLWQERDDARYLTSERKQLAMLIDAQTVPGEPIYVGCTSHRRVMMSAIDLYYVARRPGATRYMQFDPGTVTGIKGQREMIGDLERSRPRLVLRFARCDWYEPNASQVDGASLLDDYLDRHYASDGSLAGFYISHRRSL